MDALDLPTLDALVYCLTVARALVAHAAPFLIALWTMRR